MPRGKEIENPLREGLPAKIYLATFSGKNTIGEIASKIYGKEKKSNQSRISDYVGKSRFSHLYKIEKPSIGSEGDRRTTYVLADETAFLEELEENVDLDSDEKELLEDYIDGPFRKAANEEYIKTDYSKPVDAYSEILGLLLSIIGTEMASRKFLPAFKSLGFMKLLEEAEEELPSKFSDERPREMFYNFMGEYFETKNVEEVPATKKEIREPLKEFPDDLLDKLLSNPGLKGAMGTLKYGQYAFEALNEINEFIGTNYSEREEKDEEKN